LRWHIEQLQARPVPISPSASNLIWPQWQLPVYFMGRLRRVVVTCKIARYLIQKAMSYILEA
jgi:hypothetical protein